MIYTKTELGQTALQNRALALTPRQRSAFIQFDGKRSLEDVLKATSSLGVTAEDIGHLISLGLLAVLTAAPVPAAAAPGASAVAAAPSPQTAAALSQTADGQPTTNAQAHYSKAYPIATRLTAGLGLRGFRLNLAVEAASDLDKLKELAPKIREAVGPEKFLELENALYY
ncbi:MAG: hypothetical protein JWQ72_835 [Polaromonas sp.]|nr:hypothetical protein [Polaromonas sp.]